MPIDLQPKLLRAIQEGVIERLGGTQAIQVNVRLLAATNRDLPKAIEKGHIREDLYYRHNVYPNHCIPLRERREDIPVLTRFFCEKIGAKMGRKINDIPQKVIKRLLAYDFPGNVRELENLIERGVITATGGKLKLGEWLNGKQIRSKRKTFQTMEDLQKEHIIEVLQHTQWRVSGANGAAKILGMRPTTLFSKIERLGIKRSMDVEQD